MTVPYYVNEHQSDIRAIKPGWYAVERNGKLSSGPFPSQEKCLTGITQPRSNSRASSWRHSTQVAANQAHDKKARASCYGRAGLAEGKGNQSAERRRSNEGPLSHQSA